MFLTVLQLLRAPEFDVDVHFEVNMRVKREKDCNRPSFLSRILTIGEQRLVDSAEKYLSPKGLSPYSYNNFFII